MFNLSEPCKFRKNYCPQNKTKGRKQQKNKQTIYNRTERGGKANELLLTAKHLRKQNDNQVIRESVESLLRDQISNQEEKFDISLMKVLNSGGQ